MRRYFRISLRAMLLGMLLFGVLLGVFVARAERQRAEVAAIKRLGGFVSYEGFEFSYALGRYGPAEGSSPLVHQLADMLGPDYFYRVEHFEADAERAEKCLPHLRNLRGIRSVIIWINIRSYESDSKLAKDLEQQIQRMFPDCEVGSEVRMEYY
jgi:hypothetical protein